LFKTNESIYGILMTPHSVLRRLVGSMRFRTLKSIGISCKQKSPNIIGLVLLCGEGGLQRQLKTLLIFNMLCVIYFLLTEMLTSFQIQINCKSYEIKVGNCANFYKNTNSNYKSSNQASSKKEGLDK
jgi:hypothetical protein